MAKIYQKKNGLHVQRRLQIQTLLLIWLSYLLLIYLYRLGLAAAGFLAAFLSSFVVLRRIEITSSGLRGEESALDMMREVDDSYHVFSNVTIVYEGRESETDLIVVGRKGIFVIEVKNHHGIIRGTAEDRRWVQHKTGKNGGRYAAAFYNPTKQVGTHVWKMSKLLKENRIFAWVQGCVYFAHPEADVQVRSERVPVLSCRQSFAAFLQTYQPRRELDDATIERVVAYLKKQN